MHEETLTRASSPRASKRSTAPQNPMQSQEPAPLPVINAPPVHLSPFIGHASACKAGIAAITENMLKRKWSATILRRLNAGVHDAVEITKLEPGLSPKVISERLRTMHRYALVTRFPRPTGVIEYRVTTRGKKILEILNTISAVEQQLDQESIENNRRPPRTSEAV